MNAAALDRGDLIYPNCDIRLRLSDPDVSGGTMTIRVPKGKPILVVSVVISLDRVALCLIIDGKDRICRQTLDDFEAMFDLAARVEDAVN